MPSKKKKYNARFPAGRIKKIMQTDEEIGKVAQAVPVIISRTLELFVESLLKNAMQITNAKNAKTLTPTHMKQCILSESRFDFLKDLVKGIPDVLSTEDDLGASCGNISPGTPYSTKAYSDYSCFQFQHSSNSSSSRSLNSNSQPPIPQTSQPKFYKEIPIGSESCENKICENNSSPNYSGATFTSSTNQYLPYSQMTKNSDSSLTKTLSGCNNKKLNTVKLSNSFKKSDNANASTMEHEGEENELEENGYHGEKKTVTKTVPIDENYDT